MIDTTKSKSKPSKKKKKAHRERSSEMSNGSLTSEKIIKVKKDKHKKK